MYGKNIDSKNLLPELTRLKANTKAIAFAVANCEGCFHLSEVDKMSTRNFGEHSGKK